VSLEFPASAVHEIRFTSERPPEMTVNFMGLAGLLGPLPMPLTEMILASRRKPVLDENGDARREIPAVISFLDIFNHRLISLMYRVRQTHRPALSAKPPSEGPVARSLFALIGLGHQTLQGRLAYPDNALLFYSGILAQRPRSATGLKRILADYFGVPVKIRQFVGRWRNLDARQWTVLGGKDRRNFRLGYGAVAGTRVWDEQTHIRIRLGPMPRHKYLTMLPGGSAHDAVRDMIRFYLDPEITFSLALMLRREDIFSPGLGSEDYRLGFTSWVSQVELNPVQPGPVDSTVRQQAVRIETDY
jgi:type VI secretion system protein ImpH